TTWWDHASVCSVLFYAPPLKFGLLYEDLTCLHFLISPSMARGSRTTEGDKRTGHSDIIMSLYGIMSNGPSPNNPLPLYAQVESVIIGRISNGSLPPGTRLPSEDNLVEEYAVSRTTIRAPIQSLVQRGLVEIRRGKGSFVPHPKIPQELTELTGFVEGMQALGRPATAKVLDQQVVAANQV